MTTLIDNLTARPVATVAPHVVTGYKRPESLRVSNSTVNLLHDCPKQFWFEQVATPAHLVNRHSSSHAANVGTAIHEAVQAWLTVGRPDDEDIALITLLQFYPYETENLTSSTKARSLEAAVSATFALIEYIRANYGHADLLMIQRPEELQPRPAIEVPFVMHFTNQFTEDAYEALNKPNMRYSGKIDIVFVINGKLIVVDIKTHKLNLKDLSPKYKYNPQALGYGLIMNSFLPDYQKDQDYQVEYLTVYVDLAKPKVEVYTYLITPYQVREWLQGLLIDMKNIRLFNQSDFWPRNGNSCLNWNRPCTYFDICHMQDKDQIVAYLTSLAPQGDNYMDGVEPWFTVTIDLEGV